MDIKIEKAMGLSAEPAIPEKPVFGAEIETDALHVCYRLWPNYIEDNGVKKLDPKYAEALLNAAAMPEEAYQRLLGHLDDERECVEDAVAKACKAWAQWAQWKKVYEDAKQLRGGFFPCPNTKNQWVTTRYRNIIQAEISNEAFKIVFSIEFPMGADARDASVVRAAKNCEATYTVSSNYLLQGVTGISYNPTIKTGSKQCNSLDEAKKYLEGRAKALAPLYSEMRPPIPPEYAQAFTYNGVPLPAYTFLPEKNKKGEQ